MACSLPSWPRRVSSEDAGQELDQRLTLEADPITHREVVGAGVHDRVDLLADGHQARAAVDPGDPTLLLHPVDGRRSPGRGGPDRAGRYFLGMRMARSARMFFCTSVVPAPIDV